MRTLVALLAFASVATCSPASSTSTYANAYAYQNIARKGEVSYDMEYAVKGADYKSKPLDFIARESKYDYNTEGEYHAVLPEGYVCVCYAVGESAGLKCDCGPRDPHPPAKVAPPRPTPAPVCTNHCPYGRLSGYPSCECKPAPRRPTPAPVCTNHCPYGRLSGYPSCQCKSAPAPPTPAPICTNHCPYGRLYGYPSCECKPAPPPPTPAPICTNHCPYGRLSGYPSCQCKSAPAPPPCPACPKGARRAKGSCDCEVPVLTKTWVKAGEEHKYIGQKQQVYGEQAKDYSIIESEIYTPHNDKTYTLVG